MIEYQHLHLKTDSQQFLWIELAVQGYNTNPLLTTVLKELAQACAYAQTYQVKGLVLYSAHPHYFSADQDYAWLDAFKLPSEAQAYFQLGQQVCQQLAALPCPTVAMIQGLCIGSGLELAMSFKYCIASDSKQTQLGLRALQIGMHSGFGSLPRLFNKMGIQPALEAQVTNRLFSAQAAHKAGLIDACVTEDELSTTIQHYLTHPPCKAHLPGYQQAVAKLAPMRKLLSNKLRQQISPPYNSPPYPAAHTLLTLWEKQGGNLQELAKAEIQSAAELALSPTARNLRRIFRLQQRLKQAANPQLFQPRHIHIIGSDPVHQELLTCCQQQSWHVSYQHSPDETTEDIGKADVIIDMLGEQLTAKQQLFRQLEKQVQPDTLLLTHTACLPLEDIAGYMQQPERLIGVHFPHLRLKASLVELAFDEHALDTAIVARAMAFVRHLHLLPLLVKSVPGLLLERIRMTYIFEGIRLHQQGVPAAIIDEVARDFGLVLGPLELADTLGLDNCQQIGDVLEKKLRLDIPLVLYQMVREGRLGKRTGQGFHRYRHGKLMTTHDKEWQGSRELLQQRLLRQLLEAAQQCLHQGIVEDADLIDAGLLFGAGFPAFTGGPLHYQQYHSEKL